jgi:monothiol glutaredoxin
MNTEEKIRKQLAENPIILYMKGTPEAPSCGFSAKASGLLKATGKPFAYVNVLEAPFIMEKLPDVSNFPTFPQLFIQGEIIGGSDIIEEMLASGELQPLLESAGH